MEEKTNWGKKLTGGMVGAVMVREIVMAKPEMALWGIMAITNIAITFMVLQYFADKKGKGKQWQRTEKPRDALPRRQVNC